MNEDKTIHGFRVHSDKYWEELFQLLEDIKKKIEKKESEKYKEETV